ncbi:MAG: glutaminase A [Defluviicoccus sp.]
MREPALSPVQSVLLELHEKYQPDFSGAIATYIPELAKADPADFAIVLATIDGCVYEIGQSRREFTIQSVSKPFAFSLALQEHGRDDVLRKVGVEPSGDAFNAIVFDETGNRPFNPMVNAGAIAVSALITGDSVESRLQRILATFADFAGRPLQVDETVFQSERATGHRNRAIAYLELNAGMLQDPVDEHLELYFRQCSILVTARDLAIMAATLANYGVNPLTSRQAMAAEHVQSILSVMASCGMYDFAGEWSYRIGLPAKSGVAGGIIAVLPGQFGIGLYSPLLDAKGNSVRGVRVCEELSSRFALHMFAHHAQPRTVIRRVYTGSNVVSKRRRRAAERGVLDQLGHRITVFELEGDLFFASVEQLLRRLIAEIASLGYAILDGRRVGHADPSPLGLLIAMHEILAERRQQLLLAAFPAAIVRALAERLPAGWAEAHVFADVDHALEACEDALLAATAPELSPCELSMPLAEMDIVAGLEGEYIALLTGYLEEATYTQGAAIIHENDAADRLFMLAEGAAAVSVQLADGRSKRLASFGPGVSFGELALVDGGSRVADVIAESAVRCWVLRTDRFAELAEKHPRLHARLLKNIGRNLSERLRRTTREVRALEE